MTIVTALTDAFGIDTTLGFPEVPLILGLASDTLKATFHPSNFDEEQITSALPK